MVKGHRCHAAQTVTPDVTEHHLMAHHAYHLSYQQHDFSVLLHKNTLCSRNSVDTACMHVHYSCNAAQLGEMLHLQQ